MDILDSIETVDQDARSYSEVISTRYEFEFGGWISEGFQLLNKHAGWYILLSLITFFICVPLIFIPIIGWLALAFIPSILSYGIATYAANSLHGNPEFGNFFDPFKDFGQLAVIILISIAITILLSLPEALFTGHYFWEGGSFDIDRIRDILDGGGQDGFVPIENISVWPWWASWLVSVLDHIASSLLILAPLFVIFGKLSGILAIKASFALIKQHLFLAIVFVFLCSLVAGLGVILCGVGALYTYPILYLAVFAYYKNVVGLSPIYVD